MVYSYHSTGPTRWESMKYRSNDTDVLTGASASCMPGLLCLSTTQATETVPESIPQSELGPRLTPPIQLIGVQNATPANAAICPGRGLEVPGKENRFSFMLTVTTFFFSSRRRHTRFDCDWSSDVCSSD